VLIASRETRASLLGLWLLQWPLFSRTEKKWISLCDQDALSKEAVRCRERVVADKRPFTKGKAVRTITLQRNGQTKGGARPGPGGFPSPILRLNPEPSSG
jgi:hypothetical protein